MLSLKSRQDGFKFLLPNDFIPDEINEKYAKILQEKKGFFIKPIDFLNESIQKLEVFGFNGATKQQRLGGRGYPIQNQNRTLQNNFLHTGTEITWRNEVNPLDIIDKTINIDFRHSVGYLNYFLMFETFWWQYCRDMKYKDMINQFNIDLVDERGVVYARVILENPIIDGMDALNLDYTQPIASNQEFRVIWKYSNVDFQFLDIDYK